MEINNKSLVSKFQLIPILRLRVMHNYVFFSAPYDTVLKILIGPEKKHLNNVEELFNSIKEGYFS